MLFLNLKLIQKLSVTLFMLCFLMIQYNFVNECVQIDASSTCKVRKLRNLKLPLASETKGFGSSNIFDKTNSSYGAFFLQERCIKDIKRKSLKFGKILGGTDAKQGKWPWYARIHSDNDDLCGGVFFKPQWVITAAHCLNGTSFNVSLGKTDMSSEQNMSKTIVAKETFLHPNFTHNDGERIFNDIALIKLPQKVSISNVIYPACLPMKANINYSQYDCYIVGFGFTADGTLPTKLKQRKVRVLPKSLCDFQMRIFFKNITSKDICLDIQENKNACQGDSGGPLNCIIDNSVYVVGIASFILYQSNCTNKGGGDAFVDITKYYHWLQYTIESNT